MIDAMPKRNANLPNAILSKTTTLISMRLCLQYTCKNAESKKKNLVPNH